MKATRILNLTSFDRLYLLATLPAIAAGAVYLWPGALRWPHLDLLVTAQILWLAAVTLVHSAKVLGRSGALVFSGLAIGLSWLVESHLLRAAVFGSHYEYAAFLGPHLPGDVPVTIPLIWFGLCYLCLLCANATTERAGLVSRALLCGYLLCAFDLLLDPIATGTGTFVWSEPGAYYTTPVQNFAGWFGVGAAVCGMYLFLQRWTRLAPPVADTTIHQRVAGLMGLAAFVLPVALAVMIGRPGAALLFVVALSPVVFGWLMKFAPLGQTHRVPAQAILGNEAT